MSIITTNIKSLVKLSGLQPKKQKKFSKASDTTHKNKLKPGFHTCVSRRYSSDRPMPTNNPSVRSKSLRARMKVAHAELLRRDARLVPQYAVNVTYGNRECRIQKRFFPSGKKRARPRNNFITQYQMRYSIYIPLNAKDLAIDLTMLG